MSTPAHVVTELVNELADDLTDDAKLARAIDQARDRWSLAPAGWMTVERTLFGLRTRIGGARGRLRVASSSWKNA